MGLLKGALQPTRVSSLVGDMLGGYAAHRDQHSHQKHS